MFPQLDYQKKFVEKKYKFGKDNKQRRKRKSNGDRNSEPTGDSNKVSQMFLDRVQIKMKKLSIVKPSSLSKFDIQTCAKMNW